MYAISSIDQRLYMQLFIKMLNEACITAETEHKSVLSKKQQQQRINEVQKVRYHRQQCK